MVANATGRPRLIGVGVVLCMVLACTPSGQESTVGEDKTTPGFYHGPKAAPLIVTEFSDFGCPFCGLFSLFTYPVLYDEFVSTGEVRWYRIPITLGRSP